MTYVKEGVYKLWKNERFGAKEQWKGKKRQQRQSKELGDKKQKKKLFQFAR